MLLFREAISIGGRRDRIFLGKIRMDLVGWILGQVY